MDMKSKQIEKTTATHWGSYKAVVENGRLIEMKGVDSDIEPTPFAQSYVDTIDSPLRIAQPMVRRGFLEKRQASDRSKRGTEPFVPVSWDDAEQLVADELSRVRDDFGNEAIYAGCYGWASAGRFHHAQSQIHRFLKQFGGYTDSVGSYSFSAAEVILPHIIGDMWAFLVGGLTGWPSIVDNTELMVCFGGLPLKNGQVANGGTGKHVQREYMQAAKANGCKFVNIGPIRADTADFLDAEWLAPVPGSDTAIILGIAHTLVTEDLHNRAFLDKYCVGFDRFTPYLMGESDGQAKDADWAASLSGLPADKLRELARRMAAHRTMVSVSWSLQRQDHGEQTYWAATTLAAMLGQIGLPGGGIGYGYCAENAIGNHTGMFHWASLEQGINKVKTIIPVARIADMLLNPGAPFDFNGREHHYPDIRLIYWVGGNPFHHHQDLNRLRKAWAHAETVIVHEPWWNPLAKHADIALPATTTLERNDLSCNPIDGYAYPMEKVVEPVGEARNDYDIFSGVAKRLGFDAEFTENRDEKAWLKHLFNISRQRGEEAGIEMPTFEDFWEHGLFQVPTPAEPNIMLESFRKDPETNPLPTTPSGKIEIYSERIAGFGYDDCRGHATWFEPGEWLNGSLAGTYPLHLLSNQPKTRLHSQLDHGSWSRKHKIKNREAMTVHPEDAVSREIADGDVVRVFNDRGQCLAGVIVSDEVRPGVVQMSTGAWYDPDQGDDDGLCKHGNVNVLTRDKPTSKLAQACSAHTCLVQIERYDGELPEVTAFIPPEIVSR